MRLLFFFYLIVIKNCLCFIPAVLLENVFLTLQMKLFKDAQEFTETVTHDDIIKMGIVHSITEYFYNQPNGTLLVNRTKADYEYNDIRNLYFDYYGVWMCDLDIDRLIKLIFKPNVVLPDLNPKTKDLPYAHFDAEKFIESNNRVMNFTSRINSALDDGDYFTAQVLSGQILHTIQDFYSHSNWVESGKTDINYEIGYANFSKYQIIGSNESNPCISNCTKIVIQCGAFLTLLNAFVKLAGLPFKTVPCKYYLKFLIKNFYLKLRLFLGPTDYFKCDGNLVILNKLVSGYYGGQELESGEEVPKPQNLGKCSHGGLFDPTEDAEAMGGINKDSGIYLISPHANLHPQAVKLAVKHSKQFFETIRQRIGDVRYAQFLNLIPLKSKLASASTEFYVCDAFSFVYINSKSYNFILINLFFAYFFYF